MLSKRIFLIIATAAFSSVFTGEGPVATTVTPASCQECIAASSVKRELTILEVVNSGQFLVLSDNSIWKIKPSFWPISGSWIMPIAITIQESSADSDYPYLLKNNFTNESIQAQKSSMEEMQASIKAQESSSSVKPVTPTPAVVPAAPEVQPPMAPVNEETPVVPEETK
jgi:hypothetical protein